MKKEKPCLSKRSFIKLSYNNTLLKIKLTILICLGLQTNVIAQEAQILITNPAGVNVCDASQQVGIEILNIDTATLTNNSISIVLPSGIEYVPSSLSEQSSYNIVETNISNLSAITLTSDELPVSQTLQFTINIEANMDAITHQNNGNVFRNDITLSYDGGSTNSLSNAYNLYYPVLSILNISPTSKNLNSGDSFTRAITVVNAGNGRVAAFKIKDFHVSGIDVTSVDLGNLDVNGAVITLAGADFSGVGNNDNYFDTNESITVTQSISGSGCNNTTISSTITNIWECSGSQIESSNSFGHVSLSLKTPNVKVTTSSELTTCFGDGDASNHTITLKNTGQGIADAVQLDVFKSLGSDYDQNILSRIDNSSMTYSLNGGGAVPITPSTSTATDISGAYSCLGSGAIGQVVLDLPNLAAGDELVLSFKTYHCNMSACSEDYIKGWNYDLEYKDVCANNTYNSNGTGQDENKTYMSIFSETETDIDDGQTKVFSFTVSSFLNNLPADTGAKYKVMFDLPTGLTYNSLSYYHNVEWNASSINYDNSSNRVTAYYELPLPSGFNITKSALNLGVTGDCSMPGAQTGPIDIVMNISYVPGANCNFEIPFICNTTETVDLHCNSGVTCEGMSFDAFTFNRTSFGLPDNNQDGLADASGSLDMSKVKENRVMLGDTIQGIFSGTIHTSLDNPTWMFAYATQNIQKGTFLTGVSATISVFDASTSTTLVCSVLPTSSVVSGEDKTFTYNLSPCELATNCAAFNNFEYGSGDTVTVNTNYQVTSNIGARIEQLRSSNEFYTSNVQYPAAENKFQCGYYNDNFTLIGYYFLNATKNNFTATSCTRNVNQYFYLTIGDCCSNYDGGNLFPSEYRNWANIKSASVEIPDNYDMSNVVLRIWRTRKTNSSTVETVSNLTPSSIVGNVYTFDLEQHYAINGGSLNLSDDGFKGRLTMDLAPNCDVPIDTYEDLIWKFNFTKSDYLGGGESGFISANKNDRIKSKPPSLVLSSDNPIELGTTQIVSWDFKVNTSASNIDADNAWIHIKNPSENTQIVRVIDDATGLEIPVSGDIYQLGQVIGGTPKDLTIEASYSSCYSDFMTVYSGYECTEYPATFDEFACGFITYGLFVEPKPAAIQATLVGVNVGDICGTVVEIEVDVRSVKKGSLTNIGIEIDDIGSTMDFVNGSAYIEYPLGGTYQLVSDAVLNLSNNHFFNVADLEATIAANGLPGVLDLDNNRFKLKFQLEMSNTFQSGDYALVGVSSQSVCGEVTPLINLAFDPSIGFQIDDNAGLTNDITDSWAASWGDYNNDGYDDLFVTTYDASQPNILYENNGDKTFTKVTTGGIVNDTAKSLGASWGDYDNDGYLDLFVANNGGASNFLYKNNGSPNFDFTKITTGDIVEYGVYCHSAAWADYDNDGYLDLFVAEYFPTNPNLLFHNNGDGTFSRVEDSPVVTDSGHSIGAAWGDYNNDGLADLFVPNTNNEANWLYKNTGNGQFVKVNESVISNPSSSVGCSWGDYNNDGYLDLFVANSGSANNSLYVNDTDGTFTQITTGDIVNDQGNSHGSTWIDIDNDGDLDLYVTNDQEENNFLYKNNGNGTFTRSENDLTNLGGNSFGTSISDYDNDGDNDIFVANHSDNTNFFFENTKAQCESYLCMKLIGSNSNKSAIGAKVKVKSIINGQVVWQKQEVTGQSGGGAGGQNSTKLVFGLGDTTLIDTMIIEWPSGFTKTYTNLSTSTNCSSYLEDDGSKVCGVAYIDANSNCIYDEGELKLKNTKITIAPDNKIAYTNSEGEYAFYMNTGTYTITAETPAYYTQFCPTAPLTHTAVITSLGGDTCGLDFGFLADGTHSDLSVCMTTTVLRKNFTSDYTVQYDNLGNTNSSSNRIDITLNAGVEFVSSTIPWTSQTGQTAYWDIATIAAQESGSFVVTVQVTTDTTIGDVATNTVSISSTVTSDTDLSNNSCNDSSEIVGAIDPNDKLVFPSDKLPLGTPITYKIRFQNMGNYPAESVVVYDTISPRLDLTTLGDIKTSHDASFTILDENVLKWDFANINLPDVENNEPESHGYIQFQIYPVRNLDNNTPIKNSATIIFDYYQITPTNTTSIIVNPVVSDETFLAYPVPVKDHILLGYQSEKEENIEISFYNIRGSLIKQYVKSVSLGWSNLRFNLSEYSSGVYFVVLKTSDTSYTKKLIKM